MERVILRREKNPYTKEIGYLAIFPDDEANLGMVGAVSFSFNQYGKPVFEPYCEITLGYMYKQKIIHKNEEDVEKCIKTLSDLYGEEYKVCEKITRKNHRIRGF